MKNNSQISINRGIKCSKRGKGPLSRDFSVNLDGDNNNDIWQFDV